MLGGRQGGNIGVGRRVGEEGRMERAAAVKVGMRGWAGEEELE